MFSFFQLLSGYFYTFAAEKNENKIFYEVLWNYFLLICFSQNYYNFK